MIDFQNSCRTTEVFHKANPLTSRRQKVSSLAFNEVNQKHTHTKNPENKEYHKQSIKLSNQKVYNKTSFDILYPIGKGGFGKVWKVKDKHTGEIYAMK